MYVFIKTLIKFRYIWHYRNFHIFYGYIVGVGPISSIIDLFFVFSLKKEKKKEKLRTNSTIFKTKTASRKLSSPASQLMRKQYVSNINVDPPNAVCALYTDVSTYIRVCILALGKIAGKNQKRAWPPWNIENGVCLFNITDSLHRYSPRSSRTYHLRRGKCISMG